MLNVRQRKCKGLENSFHNALHVFLFYDADDGVVAETRSSVILFRVIYLSQLLYN